MSHQPGRLAKADKRTSTQSVIKPIELPEELEKVLAVLSGGILEGHIKLAAALKKRYDNQYPLVRSLADVFTAHVSCLSIPDVYHNDGLTDGAVIHIARVCHLRPSPRTSFSDRRRLFIPFTSQHDLQHLEAPIETN